MLTIGSQIKKKREEGGVTQAELAQRMGVATITIRQYESGKRNPKLGVLRRIADALEIPLGQLVGNGSPNVERLIEFIQAAEDGGIGIEFVNDPNDPIFKPEDRPLHGGLSDSEHTLIRGYRSLDMVGKQLTLDLVRQLAASRDRAPVPTPTDDPTP